MASNIPAEVLQQQANTTAPGVQPTQQAQPKNLASGREQPGQKGKKTAAAKVYPKLASQADKE
jgi:hypothetical protein